MVFANGWGGGAQVKGELMHRRGQWSSPWTTIEKDGLLLPGGNLLDGGVWAAVITVNIRRVIADREDAFRMGPEGGGFDPIVGVVDGSRTGEIGCTGRAPLVRPRDRNGLCRGLCSVRRLSTTVGKFARGTSKLRRGQRLES